jgi:uncharacterized RDD family membrane protein YckC
MENNKFTITADLVASREQRFVNFILDFLFIYVIWIGLGTTIIIIGEITGIYALSNWAESTTTYEKMFFWIIVMFLYYFLTEMYFSRTFAKYFSKTIVITKDGLKPGFNAILIRTLTRFIPLEGLTFLGVNVRGLHDLFSDTYVVRKHEFNKKKGVVLFP